MDILAPILPDTNFPDYVDFKTLRREGLEHIASFSGKLWTDHNIHDPGITILEVLCYVLTDLDYRTKLDFKDLVTKEHGPAATNFFTPAQILGNNPLTVMDYRKMLIDIIGVRNAWLEPINPLIKDAACDDKKETEPGYFLSYDCQSRQLQNAGEATSNLKLPLHGLYKVLIEPDDIYPSAFEKNACGNSEFNQDFVIEEAGRRLQAHRNLCEDFADIVLLAKEPVSFCLHVELKPDADPDEVLTNIFRVVQDFFSPAPQFYTLKQMLNKGKTMDEIFEGRPMDFQSPDPKTVQKNGFIDTEELQNLPRHRIIYTSDLYRIIMGVDGVDGITRLVLFSEVQPAVNQKGGEEWILNLLADHRPVLSTDNCNVIFFKNKLPFSIDAKKARERYLKGLSDFNKSEKNKDELDQLIPVGRKLNIDQYKSVQYEFPRAYYIGKNVVPGDAPPLRKVQSLQLQGYLLFYDRLLADYFAQLSNILPLFSLQKNGSALHTYFTAGLDGIPMLPSLLRGFQKQVDYGTCETPYNGMKLAFEPIPEKETKPDKETKLQYKQRTYKTSYSRDEAIQRMMNACSNASLEPGAESTQAGRFYFVLYDTNETRFLQSYLHFDTEADALRAARDVIFMGGLPSCYQRNNELQNGEFSFDLVFHKTDYKEHVGSLNEPESVFFERKEKFLNHLLARFAEDFTDYVLMMYALNGKKNDPARTIEDKQAFLSAYPDLSSNRGKAFDYSIQENKFPVSGLQKRVASLMGIHPYPEVSLNNFDIIPLHGQWFFRFFLPGDQSDAMPLFESVSVFNSEEEARSASERFLELASNIDNYKNNECSDEKVYGFSVQSPSKDKVWINARCTLSFTGRGERNEIKEWLSRYIKANGKYTSGILLHQGSYFLFYDDKSKLLLKSAEGYSSEEKAREALYRCYQLAHIDEAWEVINADNTNRKIIGVSDPAFERRIPLARHPRSFTSPEEADATMKTLKEFFGQKDLVYNEDSQPAWQWRLIIDTMAAWRTTRVFKKHAQLPGSFIQFLELASNGKNYDYQKQAGNSWQLRLTREEEIEEELANRQTILGECLEKFSTEELAKQALELYVENNNYLWLWFNKSVREVKGYTYEFYDANVGDTEILLKTTVLVPGGASGSDMLSAMISLATSPTTLVITTTSSSGDDGCMYQLQLKNEFQQVLAVTKEVSKNEAEELQTRITSLSARGFLFWKKADERNGYSIVWQNEEGVDLLLGLSVFGSREEAMQALAGWLMNYSPENFYPHHIPGKEYGYTVQLSGQPALGELFHFHTADERDNRLHELKNSIETLLRKFDLKPEESRQYFFSIKDKEGKILLREVEPQQSLFEIQNNFYDACRLGKIEDQYNKKDGCTYGFALQDEKKTPLAIHPIEYLTAKERDVAMKHVIRFLEEHAPVTLIETLPGSWRYKWEWLSCNYTIETALESLEERTNEKEASDDMKLILQCAKEITFYTIVEKEKKERDQKTKYSIYLRDGADDEANWLALHPQDYTCKTKAGKVIQRLVDYARFELNQGARFDKKFGADERLQSDNDKKEGFRLWDRQFRMANYYRGYTSAGRRDKAARETWMHYKKYNPPYTILDQSNAIIEEDETSHLFFFNLVTNDGVFLWRSAEDYEEQEEAKSAFKKQYLEILELSRDKSNYNNWEPGVTSLLLYGKKCGSEEKILMAVFKGVFAKPEDFAQAIRMRQEAAHSFPVFKDGKSYAFRLYRADLKTYEWKGANQYATAGEAWKAFTIFLELLGYAANYYPENRPEGELYTISLRKVLFDIQFDPEKQTKLYPGWKTGSAIPEIVSDSDPLQQFLSFISQDETMFYPFTDYADRCRYGLRLVNQNRYRIARHTLWYESRTKREEERRKLQAEFNCSLHGPAWLDCPEACFEFPGLIDKEKIWRSPELVPKQEQWVYESFQDELGNTLYRYQLIEVPDMMKGKNKCRVIWRSVNHYRDEPDYCMGKMSENFFYVEIMEMARSAGAYVYEPIIGKGQHYRLYLRDIDGQVVAEAPEIICGDPIQDRNIRMINAMLYPVFKKEDGYCFEINKVCQRTKDGGVTGYFYSTIWEGLQIFDSPNKAFDAYHHALSLLTDLRNYERTDYSACGPFGIELVDPLQVMAVHPITYPDNEQRSEAIREIEKAISSEGFHVLEHILLRPVQSCQTSKYLFIDLVLYPPRSGKKRVLFRIRSQSFFESPVSFIKALQVALKEDKIYIQKQDDRFVITFWNALQELLAEAEVFKNNSFPKKKASLKKKAVDDIIDPEKVCDDITKLLNDQLPKLNEGDVHTGDDSDPCCSESKLLSLCSEDDPCDSLKQGVDNDASCDPGFLADPYSFWATVVVPSWPRRFLLPRFREFFEKKLRDEAPAHVRLRIVWVSPSDMHRFEKALSKWLQALARKEGCDYQSKLSRLTEVLTQIRNEYPTAQLFGEGQGGFAAVLDEIVLK